jgi:hypothetical protein
MIFRVKNPSPTHHPEIQTVAAWLHEGFTYAAIELDDGSWRLQIREGLHGDYTAFRQSTAVVTIPDGHERHRDMNSAMKVGQELIGDITGIRKDGQVRPRAIFRQYTHPHKKKPMFGFELVTLTPTGNLRTLGLSKPLYKTGRQAAAGARQVVEKACRLMPATKKRPRQPFEYALRELLVEWGWDQPPTTLPTHPDVPVLGS